MPVNSLFFLADTASLVTLNAPVTAFVILYIGPEIILPVASAIASLVGLLLMFWRYVTKAVRKFFRRLFSRKRDVVDADPALAVDTADGEPSDGEAVNDELVDGKNVIVDPADGAPEERVAAENTKI